MNNKEMYIFNPYLIANTDISGNIIIFNTLYQNFVRIPKGTLPIFLDLHNQILKTGNYTGPIENLHQLIDQKVIISSPSANFDKELANLRNKVLNSKDELMITLLPTQQCNFRCKYCYEDFKNIKMEDNIIEKIVSFIDATLPKYKSLHLCWFGGEPLLALNVIEDITTKASNICKKHKKSFYSSITTNGYLLNLDTFKKLLRLHIMQFQVTLDGDKYNHDKQRVLVNGSETFDTILANLLTIKKHIKTSTIKIIIRINISNQVNSCDIQNLIDLFSDDNRFSINLQRIFSTNNYKESTSETKYSSIIKKCNSPNSYELLPEHNICYAAKTNTLVIGADGTLYKCTVNFEDPQNKFKNIIDFDAKNFSLESLHYSHSQHNEKDCIKCCIYPLCLGAQCPARQIQLCKTIIDKYKAMITNNMHRATQISLK